MVAARISYFH